LDRVTRRAQAPRTAREGGRGVAPPPTAEGAPGPRSWARKHHPPIDATRKIPFNPNNVHCVGWGYLTHSLRFGFFEPGGAL